MYSDRIKKIGDYKLNVAADAPDFRDWHYQPALIELAPSLSKPRNLKILDQGDESSCTGFALAAVINILRRHSRRPGRVSERMLYEMAKRHDEWRGYRYEGSSCRGAIKGWYNMGVCSDKRWPYVEGDPRFLTVAAAKEARKNTLGAYYRLGTRISDFHSALNEVGVVYCSADVHDGWESVSKTTGIIPLDKNTAGGHAFAIVGYNKKGFWIQNSWGEEWGKKGTALWLYEDWQQNLSDAWVLRLAVETPQVWHLPREGGSDAGRAEGLFRKSPTRGEIAGHFVHIDDGEIHDSGRYWSTMDDVRQTANLLAKSDKYDHLLLYAHGGLNNITASARRIAAMKETFKENRIYPYHFMYDTGLLEEIKDVVVGKNREATERAGGLADWTDKIIEHLTHKPGRALWRQMKLGSRTPFEPDGAGRLVLKAFLDELAAAGNTMQIHLAGHSTGAILQAYLVEALCSLAPKQRIKSVSLMAPAASDELFKAQYLPLLKAPKSKAGIDRMTIYNLSKELELDDNVAGVYRKSLLYLVSRAFEENPRPAEIFGMQIDNKPPSETSDRLTFHYSDGPSSQHTQSKSHGGFDNDVATMNTVLRQIFGKKPKVPFTAQSLKY